MIKACLELGKDPAETIAVFRIPGAWEEEGAKILSKYGIEFRDRNTSMWEAAGEAVAKIQGTNGSGEIGQAGVTATPDETAPASASESGT